jgi:hypothetical protein
VRETNVSIGSGEPSGLRPASLVMSDTPVEVQFTSAGCLNYPCRTAVAGSLCGEIWHKAGVR